MGSRTLLDRLPLTPRPLALGHQIAHPSLGVEITTSEPVRQLGQHYQCDWLNDFSWSGQLLAGITRTLSFGRQPPPQKEASRTKINGSIIRVRPNIALQPTPLRVDKIAPILRVTIR